MTNGRAEGIDILGTGDFSHPEWNKELKQELTEDGTGILKSKSGFHFVLSNEISLMYSQDGKGRRVHLVLLALILKQLIKLQVILEVREDSTMTAGLFLTSLVINLLKI